MKKTFSSIILVLILLLVPTIVHAAEGDVAKVGEKTFKTFEEALNYAKTNEQDLTILTTVNVNKDTVIDISGVNITGAQGVKNLFIVKGANFTIKGNGSISTTEDMAIRVIGNNNQSDYKTKAINSTLKIEKNVKITAPSHCVFIYGNGAKADIYGDLTTTKYDKAAVQGSGNVWDGNTIINIYEGAKIEHTDNDVAIYHPQTGKLNIYGGTIKGITGVEMRAGELLVEGGTIIGNGKPTTVQPNGSGSTSTGCGIAVSQHTTQTTTKVVVNGGTIQGYSAIYETNPQKNNIEAIKKVSIEVNGGKFESINGGNIVVYSENKTKFVKKGIFNKDIEAKYLVDNATSEKDSSGNYAIGIRHNIVIQKSENGTVSTTVTKAIEGDIVELTVTPKKGYRLSKLTVNGENVVDNKFKMPTKDATITAEFELKPISVESVVSGTETGNQEIGIVETDNLNEILNSSLKTNQELNNKVEESRKEGKEAKFVVNMQKIDEKDLTDEDKDKMLAIVSEDGTVCQYFDISVLVTIDNEEYGKLTDLTDKMKFSIQISEDLIKEGRKFYIIKLHNGKTEKIEAVVNGTNLEFETDKFSTFALAYEDASAVGEKDDTPKTGALYVSTFIWMTIATVAFVSITKTKKISKHSK